MRHVITLSTIPPRFKDIGQTLQSLVAQRSRPEAVELWIPHSYRRFPQWGGGLPEVPEGVTIRRVEADLGPATKVLPASLHWRGRGVELIYLDDDRVYAPSWAADCLKVRQAHPDAAICGAGFSLAERYGYPVTETPLPRMVKAPDPIQQPGFLFRRLLKIALGRGKVRLSTPWHRFSGSGYTDVAEGYGGVMVKPEAFAEADLNIPPVLWAVDDIWLSGCLARRGIPIWADRSLYRVREVIDVSLTHPLFKQVIEGADRKTADRACVDYMRATYGIWGGGA
jgi:hypothetical protein